MNTDHPSMRQKAWEEASRLPPPPSLADAAQSNSNLRGIKPSYAIQGGNAVPPSTVEVELKELDLAVKLCEEMQKAIGDRLMPISAPGLRMDGCKIESDSSVAVTNPNGYVVTSLQKLTERLMQQYAAYQNIMGNLQL